MSLLHEVIDIKKGPVKYEASTGLPNIRELFNNPVWLATSQTCTVF